MCVRGGGWGIENEIWQINQKATILSPMLSRSLCTAREHKHELSKIERLPYVDIASNSVEKSLYPCNATVKTSLRCFLSTKTYPKAFAKFAFPN